VNPRVVLATRNAHKVPEIHDILADEGIELDLVGVTEFPDVDDVVESGLTYEENSLLKARSVAAATGLPALADDSGLSVDALNGMPGVFSGRWSGRHGDDVANLRLLLAQVGDVPDEHLGAAFVSVAALVVPRPDGTFAEISREGRVRGHLVREPRGTNGFGYDPIFVPADDTRTLAEHTAAEKNVKSHRSVAFRAIAPLIADSLRD
jgi:XTP/dITP diphosphohydrolase